jgi:class 3 adenylate cyclase
MRCSSCDFDNAAGKNFCIRCGATLGTRCPKCGSEIPPEAGFCGECGAALSKRAAIVRSVEDAGARVVVAHGEPHEVPEGERKTVTALFADIQGSTELMRDLDPEEARAIVDPVLKLMMDAVHRYEGYVAQSTGDRILAVFGAPLAHEDHPQLEGSAPQGQEIECLER